MGVLRHPLQLMDRVRGSTSGSVLLNLTYTY